MDAGLHQGDLVCYSDTSDRAQMTGKVVEIVSAGMVRVEWPDGTRISLIRNLRRVEPEEAPEAPQTGQKSRRRRGTWAKAARRPRKP